MQMTPRLGARTVCLPQKGIAEPEKLKTALSCIFNEISPIYVPGPKDRCVF